MTAGATTSVAGPVGCGAAYALVVLGTVIFCAVVVVIAARQCVNGYTVVTVVGAGYRCTIGIYEIVRTVIICIINPVARRYWGFVCACCCPVAFNNYIIAIAIYLCLVANRTGHVPGAEYMCCYSVIGILGNLGHI